MKEKVGIGIIGTGIITGKHIQAINLLENGQLLGLMAYSQANAKEAEQTFGTKVYTDLDAFLSIPGLDLVVICTPSGHHMEYALVAAKAGKHVLIEKPIEVTLEKADLIINSCKSSGVKCGVIFQNRFSQDYIKLKQAVNDGKLGKLLMGNAHINWYRTEEYYNSSNWKGTLSGDGGGAFINQGIHTIDLLLDIMGDVKMVFGKIDSIYHTIEGEDIGAAVLNFKNGALGSITASTALYPGYPERLEIYGSLGSVILEAGKLIAWNIKGEDLQVSSPDFSIVSGSSDPMAIGFQLHLEQYRDIVSAILLDREPLVNGLTARKSLELILTIYKSSKTNEPIFY
ncbi:Gfo/Idh/MocA family protein [Cecembia rubra]|uniref:Putative dehydrogenase n=1 Tax=Cecembia rubra TaxID=1485585 RepID=A0A2P8EDQ8_9BACT|nr:Gfo/Idh/MocA family oxidoreductase [Cecembia rubra]PSL07591.1 putative dehydrogenase [Cecembia rubra]